MPHFGRDGDEARRQVLDALLPHRGFKPRAQPVAADQAAAAKETSIRLNTLRRVSERAKLSSASSRPAA